MHQLEELRPGYLQGHLPVNKPFSINSLFILSISHSEISGEDHVAFISGFYDSEVGSVAGL